MGFDNSIFYSSDYGSASTSNPGSPWRSMDSWPLSPALGTPGLLLPRSLSSDPDAVRSKCSFGDDTCALTDKMEEFKRNGFDSPYDPEEDTQKSLTSKLSGMGPPSGYLRQKSWPEPERSPAPPLPRPSPRWPDNQGWPTAAAARKQLPEEAIPRQYSVAANTEEAPITYEQLLVLQSLPNAVLYDLLRDLQCCRVERRAKKRLPNECRFCKNNGERESYYRSHELKDTCGRVTCPVLRALVCRRCGATGDDAHTIKYCHLSTEEERNQSAAVLRSMRMASGRRRGSSHGPEPQPQPYCVAEPDWHQLPLAPEWAALERKLLDALKDGARMTSA